MIVQEIRESQKGNQQATLNLIERFAPLLNKYARKLEPEDGFYDLQLEFLELILHLDCDKVNMQNDGALVNYLAHSIYHSYIKLLKRVITRKAPTISTEELTDQEVSRSSKNIWIKAGKHSFICAYLEML